jgi:hypothetical protein
MTLGLIFWILMLLWLVFSLWQNRATLNAAVLGGSALQFLLFLVLGWAAFGAPVRG